MNIHSPHIATRAALYLRVSTPRQAEHAVSIPDQRKQGEDYCATRFDNGTRDDSPTE